MAAAPTDRTIVTLTPNPAVDVGASCERVEPNRKLRCSSPRVDPGGGGINVSRVIARLGGATCAVFTAGGATGARLVEAVESEAIPIDAVAVRSPTRESFSVSETATGDLFRFVLPGASLDAGEAEALLDRFAGRLPGAALAVASGSLPEGVGEDFWGRAAARAKAAGTPFVLDSSRGVEAALAVGVSTLRFNRNEVEAFACRTLAWPAETAAWCRARVAEGKAERVIVTHGADGAILTDARGHFLSRPPAVEADSAVGAGDSFIAGLTFALARGDAPEEALRLAVVSAAAALVTGGTELARRADIERLLALAPPVEPLAADPA